METRAVELGSQGEGRCAACGNSVMSQGQGWAASEAVLCPSCAPGKGAAASQLPRLPLALLGGAFGALVSAFFWALIAIISDIEFGYAAVGVGFLAGLGVKLGAGAASGRFLQGVAAAFAVLGLVVAKYFIFVFYLVKAWREEGLVVSYLHPALLGEFLSFLPQMLSGFDALWALLAVGTAWKIPAPPKDPLDLP